MNLILLSPSIINFEQQNWDFFIKQISELRQIIHKNKQNLSLTLADRLSVVNIYYKVTQIINLIYSDFLPAPLISYWVIFRMIYHNSTHSVLCLFLIQREFQEIMLAACL